jgi:hypothetical protein
VFFLQEKPCFRPPRKIRLMEVNAKCRHLKKFTCKGTLVCFLSEAQNQYILLETKRPFSRLFLLRHWWKSADSLSGSSWPSLKFSASWRFTPEKYCPSLVQYTVPAGMSLNGGLINYIDIKVCYLSEAPSPPPPPPLHTVYVYTVLEFLNNLWGLGTELE